MREYQRKWYLANREKCNASNRKHQLKIYARLQAYKVEAGCKHCGYNRCAAALDFDHVRGQKLMAVSQMASRQLSWAKIATEIKKCDVVCANCHRELTAERIQHAKHGTKTD